MNRAVAAAQSVAEIIKATGGDLDKAQSLFYGYSHGFTIQTSPHTSDSGYTEITVHVKDLSGNLIYHIPVTVMEVAQ